MPFNDLSEVEQKVIYECLEASVKGSFFPEWEFGTLFGLNRKQIEVILEDWVIVDKDSSLVILAINNSLNNLIGYPHKCEHEWDDFISVSRQELKTIFAKWRGATTKEYFKNMM